LCSSIRWFAVEGGFNTSETVPCLCAFAAGECHQVVVDGPGRSRQVGVDRWGPRSQGGRLVHSPSNLCGPVNIEPPKPAGAVAGEYRVFYVLKWNGIFFEAGFDDPQAWRLVSENSRKGWALAV